ncbi:hypothetical protein NCC49_006430 [Naganishia albida]|nr:hypothetical protein NCC49_006430 [Naganishia albida]
MLQLCPLPRSEETNKVDATQTKKKLAPAGGMLNLNSRDPFADADFGGPSGSGTPVHEEPRGSDKIHIRIQQRNGRKMLTTVQGLGKEYDAKKVLKAFKKEFACNGTVVSSEDADEEGTPEPSNKAKQNFGQVIQLQGDQRAKIREFLISTGMVTERDAKEKIQVHGH